MNNPTTSQAALLPMEAITLRILNIRDQRVIVDADLAALYDVPTKVLVQAVKRNIQRFPADFMFQLDNTEFASLRLGYPQTVVETVIW